GQTGQPRQGAVIRHDTTGEELDLGETNRYIEKWIGDMFAGDSRQVDREEREERETKDRAEKRSRNRS
ncbi:hypothetical protein HPB47_015975, partial [Ixodes persulcatus]